MTTDLETLEAVVASQTEMLLRFARLGDHGTAGPHADEHPAVEGTHLAVAPWIDGWWRAAHRTTAHPGRMGPPIKPCCSIIHTTDMLPDEWSALLAAWQMRLGDGACAHFLIGRSAVEGVAQLVSINRNGQHAGGPGHGVYQPGSIHPNTIAVGIELHCAGGVRLLNGAWRLVELGRAHGKALPPEDVIPDTQRPGRGWHVVTDYQRTQLDALLRDLELVLAPVPAGLKAKSTGEMVPTWGEPKSTRVVGHVSLDPEHRSDPHPMMMGWINAR